MWQRVWGSLRAPTTCSVSHILSHLWGGGTYLVQSTTQLLHNTFSRHQTLHSRGARELRRARLLPWPLSLSRFPRTEGKCSDQPSQNACCTILTNRHRSCAQNNHRHCCCDGNKQNMHAGEHWLLLLVNLDEWRQKVDEGNWY